MWCVGYLQQSLGDDFDVDDCRQLEKEKTKAILRLENVFLPLFFKQNHCFLGVRTKILCPLFSNCGPVNYTKLCSTQMPCIWVYLVKSVQIFYFIAQVQYSNLFARLGLAWTQTYFMLNFRKKKQSKSMRNRTTNPLILGLACYH